jgi:hypothetical protein
MFDFLPQKSERRICKDYNSDPRSNVDRGRGVQFALLESAMCIPAVDLYK